MRPPSYAERDSACTGLRKRRWPASQLASASNHGTSVARNFCADVASNSRWEPAAKHVRKAARRSHLGHYATCAELSLTRQKAEGTKPRAAACISCSSRAGPTPAGPNPIARAARYAVGSVPCGCAPTIGRGTVGTT
jgi:hypothetical protein